MFISATQKAAGSSVTTGNGSRRKILTGQHPQRGLPQCRRHARRNCRHRARTPASPVHARCSLPSGLNWKEILTPASKVRGAARATSGRAVGGGADPFSSWEGSSRISISRLCPAPGPSPRGRGTIFLTKGSPSLGEGPGEGLRRDIAQSKPLTVRKEPETTQHQPPAVPIAFLAGLRSS